MPHAGTTLAALACSVRQILAFKRTQSCSQFIIYRSHSKYVGSSEPSVANSRLENFRAYSVVVPLARLAATASSTCAWKA